MNLDIANGTRINTMLGKRVFADTLITSDEVKAATGLSLKELMMCWIFDPRNDFQKALTQWREDGEPMRFEDIQRY